MRKPQISGWWFAVVFALATFSALTTALMRPLWNDEVCTLVVARQNTLAAIWNVLVQGADSQPPIFYLLSAKGLFSTMSLGLGEEVGLRAPAIIGFVLLILTTYAFMRRAKGSAAGLLAVAILITSELLYYGSEARPYGAVLGCLGLGSYLWQRRKHGDTSLLNLAALLLTLTLCCALHHFALFAAMIFGLVEIVLAIRTRRPDWTLLFTLPVAVIPAIWARPLIAAVRVRFGTNYWARPTVKSIFAAYDFTFVRPQLGAQVLYRLPSGREIALGDFVIPLVLLAAVACLVWRKSRNPGSEKASRWEPELLLGIGFFLLPAIVGVIAIFFLEGFTPRYAAGGLLGSAIVVAWAVDSIGQRWTLAFAALLMLVFVSQQFPEDLRRASAWVSGDRPALVFHRNLTPVYRRVEAGVPVVFADGHMFMEAANYTEARYKPNLLYLLDPKTAIALTGNNSVDLTDVGLKPYFDISMPDAAGFLAAHPGFVMANSGNTEDWLTPYLRQHGARLAIVEQNSRVKVWDVNLR